MSTVTHLECTKCGAHLSAGEIQNVCPKDGGILFACYDLQELKQHFKPESLLGREASLWRYREVLPKVEAITLGEGFTPLLPSREFSNVWIKDEGLNPTGSFKARGISVAISVAKSLGLKKLAMPSAGNAASALAAYAAASGIEAHIFMPRDVPLANRIECEAYAAEITLVDGLISDCARIVSERKEREGWFDLSTLKEPYRVEGKKTMAYEIFEQLGGKLPDAVIFPSGGGVGVIGMWKAFDEMEELGWIGAERPRMIVVQAEGCAPLVKAWNEEKSTVQAWQNASTIAAGLRVPKPYGDYLVLDILKQSGGTAVAVSDEEIKSAVRHWASTEGIFAAPEGAASFAAYHKLRQPTGGQPAFLSKEDNVVLFNTGTGLKYLDVLQEKTAPATRHIGGIIGPY
ncbi:MAG TPA: threonine synthase [Terriglobales bacterium]|nr:threonine synthase [Terriglobales bacterium]